MEIFLILEVDGVGMDVFIDVVDKPRSILMAKIKSKMPMWVMTPSKLMATVKSKMPK